MRDSQRSPFAGILTRISRTLRTGAALSALVAVGALAPAEAARAATPSSMADIYAALRMENLVPYSGSTTFTSGDVVYFKFDVRNTSSSPLVIPENLDYSGSFYLVGAIQTWVERLGPDPTIPSMWWAGRDGNRYAAGGEIFAVVVPENTIPAGGVIQRFVALSTADFLAGHYRYYVEYKQNWRDGGSVIQTLSIDIANTPEPPDSTPPTIICSGPLTLECAAGLATGTVSAVVQDSNGLPLNIVWTLDGIPSQTNTVPAGGALTPTNLTFTADFQLGEHIVAVTGSNGATNPATCSMLVTVRDTTPPTITCPADVVAAANAGCLATGLNLAAPTTTDGCGVAGVTNNAPLSFPLGTNLVTWTAFDSSGNSASCLQQVIVRDTTPPLITRIAATPNVLWPPNHRMIPVSVMVKSVDTCDPSPVVRVTQVTSNEPRDPLAPDWDTTGPQTLNLRAERLGKGDGRVYTIVVQCEDASGNVSTASVNVTVPHN